MNVKSLVLETSSYLPLLWRTPYSHSLVEILRQNVDKYEFLLQRDCVREGAAYLSFEDDWRYNPAVRFQRLAERLSDSDLNSLPFPSTAVQLLLGGNIWPQAQYLNFVRHTVFFFVDILDGISFRDPREGLTQCAKRITERLQGFRLLFQTHESANDLLLPRTDILPYWGTWYLPIPPTSFHIRVVDDPRPYNLATAKLRDVYHYECAMTFQPPAEFILVANTGFGRTVRTSVKEMPFPVRCASTLSAPLFGHQK